MSEETYYTALGIAEAATREEIKQAYRSLLKKIHPDTVSTLSEETRRHAEEATREINEAYSVLSDPAQRAEYDYSLAEQRRKRMAARDTQTAQTRNPSASNGVANAGDAPSAERLRRRRRRRRSHRRRRLFKRQAGKSLFRPVSVTDWLVLFGYVLLAVVLLAIVIAIFGWLPKFAS